MSEVSPTEEQVRFYDDNGYLVVEGVFNDQECNEWIAFLKVTPMRNFQGS